MNNSLTIITTVYNRKDKLINLYNTLVQQTDKNFKWLIVDDGSEANLYELVSRWIQNSKIYITFLREKNKGKMLAYKYATEMLDTPWSIVVDSDDYLSKNAVYKIKQAINELSHKSNYSTVAGVVFPKKINQNGYEKKWKNVSNLVNIIELKYLYNITESTILIRTEFLKQAMMIIQDNGEKFCSEEIIYNELIKYGKFLVNKSCFYYAEYQEDGLTSKVFSLWLKNPQNTLYLLNSRYKALKCIKGYQKYVGRVKTILNLNAFCMKKRYSIMTHTPNKLLSIVLYLPSIIFAKFRFSFQKGKKNAAIS